MNKLNSINDNTYKLYFAEDEKPARDKLTYQLSLMNDIDVIGYGVNGKQAIADINSLKPDIILLDIQMPEVNGIELIDLLDYQPVIIYTTAYDQFAVNAFEKSSLDYLLKPYPLVRLKQALEKAKLRITQREAAAHLNKKPQLKNNKSIATLNKLISKKGERMRIISPNNIIYISSEQSSVSAWDGKKFFPLDNSLENLEQNLSAHNFIRIHRSYLINIDFIKEIQRWFNGKLMIIMNDQIKTELTTSRTGANKLKMILGIIKD
ncbi:LytR/AlgR family response regulator transcription factor [Thalassotalea ganghwensis]